ncbi:MAG: DUF2794 domain-containing protein [Alphaproteobacteria bacterium]|nr:DUF2794 domain-containing protein [Alphaproteobacteria bacterium]
MPPRQAPSSRSSGRRRTGGPVTFTRSELSAILDLYAHRVSDGAWRDYAIDHLPGSAVFSVYRNSLDKPLFSIAKTTSRGTEFVVYEGTKLLKRTSSIKDAVRMLGRKLEIVK